MSQVSTAPADGSTAREGSLPSITSGAVLVVNDDVVNVVVAAAAANLC